jgi:hypothetical protein
MAGMLLSLLKMSPKAAALLFLFLTPDPVQIETLGLWVSVILRSILALTSKAKAQEAQVGFFLVCLYFG